MKKTDINGDPITPERKSTSSYHIQTVKHRDQVYSFVVDKDYVIEEYLGKGAYGVVAKATDVKLNKKVAIKKINGAFCEGTYVSDAKRILREVKMMSHCRHANICGLLDIIPPFDGSLVDVYLVSELMEFNLHEVIYSSRKLEEEQIRFFMYQLINGTKFLHESGIIHRDLKPCNILLKSSCHLQICDFGLARCFPDGDVKDKSTYVVTRWYRPPELLLWFNDYNAQVDIWSLGCIFVELYDRHALFQGDDWRETISQIMKIVDLPTRKEIDALHRPERNSRRNNERVRICHSITDHHRRHRRLKSFEKRWLNSRKGRNKSYVKHPTLSGLDLIKRMLTFNPLKRIDCNDAFYHPYIAKCAHRRKRTEIQAAPFDCTYEPLIHELDHAKSIFLDEILQFRSDLPHPRSMYIREEYINSQKEELAEEKAPEVSSDDISTLTTEMQESLHVQSKFTNRKPVAKQTSKELYQSRKKKIKEQQELIQKKHQSKLMKKYQKRKPFAEKNTNTSNQGSTANLYNNQIVPPAPPSAQSSICSCHTDEDFNELNDNDSSGGDIIDSGGDIVYSTASSNTSSTLSENFTMCESSNNHLVSSKSMIQKGYSWFFKSKQGSKSKTISSDSNTDTKQKESIAEENLEVRHRGGTLYE